MDKEDRFTKGLPTSAVPETLRIRFTRELNDLREGTVSEVNFPTTLSTVERKFLHGLAQELGLTSKSKGKDEKRYITVTKGKKSGANNEDIIHPYFDLDPKSKKELMGPLSKCVHVLSSTKKAVVKNSDKDSDGLHKSNQKKSATGRKGNRFASPEKVEEHFMKCQEQRRKNKEYAEIQRKRRSLPSSNHAADVVEMVRGHQISLISGETGCGKTTQVPQFILDDPEMGRTCRIAVTQPRRISATSVAERIAFERSEKIGDVVGYNIRLENEVSPNSKVIFMTPGVLLRMAQENPDMDDFTHIIIDEAHERDRYTDFLFIILRDLLVLNQTVDIERRRRLPKLVLMSATLQTQKLSDYFGGIPNLHIGTSVHPVQQFYLEHILRFVGFFDDNAVSSSKKRVGNVVKKIATKVYTCPICQSKQKFLSSEELGTHVASCFGVPSFDSNLYFQGSDNNNQNIEDVDYDVEPEVTPESDESDEDDDDDEYSSKPPECVITSDVSGISSTSATGSFVDAEISKSDEDLLQKYQVSWDDSETDYDLIESLLSYVCDSEYTRNNDATILIFLPGWETISSLTRVLQDSPQFGNEKRYKVIPLHSGIPKNLQREAFKPPPPGVLKIVLSTNIAETSVTIDNVTVVIDTGRAKEKGYDPHLKLSSLKENWISQSSARQRKGRAGRTRPGVCFRLYSSRRHESLPPFQESEMLRSSLEELALMCKIMGLAPGHGNCKGGDDLHSFLLRAMDPPHTLSISNAIELLENINCLDKTDGKVTPLGYAVSQLPVDPCVGRLMVLGLMVGCGPNAIKTACAMSYRDPFVMPVNEQQKVKSKIMKRKLAADLPSDQIAVVRAVLQFNKVSAQQNFRGVQKFCDDNFLSRNTMNYLQSLCQSVSQNVQVATGVNSNSSASSRNNGDFSLLNAMVGFGLYSNIAVRKQSVSIFTTEKGRKAKVHPSSLNNSNSSNSISAFKSSCDRELDVIGFQDLVSLTPQKGRDARIGGASVQMLSTSPMSVFVLILACGSFDTQLLTDNTDRSDPNREDFVLSAEEKLRGLVLGVVDHWLPIRMHISTFRLMCDTRECLNDAISSYLNCHRRNKKSSNDLGATLPDHVTAFIDAVATAFSIEHSSKVSAPHHSLTALVGDEGERTVVTVGKVTDDSKVRGGRGGRGRGSRSRNTSAKTSSLKATK